VVVLHDHVREGAVAGPAREVRMREVRVMRERPGDEEEEGALSVRVGPDVGGRLRCNPIVDEGAVLQGVGLHRPDGFATPAFDELGDRRGLRVEADLT
jgi:hypothetical protein